MDDGPWIIDDSKRLMENSHQSFLFSPSVAHRSQSAFQTYQPFEIGPLGEVQADGMVTTLA